MSRHTMTIARPDGTVLLVCDLGCHINTPYSCNLPRRVYQEIEALHARLVPLDVNTARETCFGGERIGSTVKVETDVFESSFRGSMSRLARVTPWCRNGGSYWVDDPRFEVEAIFTIRNDYRAVTPE